MTTNHHTNIATGAAANASTFNNPLGQLDAAIDQVDDRIDTIIASSGTSSTEVVDARSGYSVLDKRIDDLYLRGLIFLVDASFNGLSAANRFTTIAAAMAAATAGTTILIANGTYTEDVTFSQANISLIGSGQPYFDGTNLIGGTIIKGRINCAGKRGAKVKNLGVDVRSTAQVDAVTADAATVGTAAIYQEFESLILIGKGPVGANQGHGILCSTGGGNTIRNCKFYYWFHGVALRCSNSIVSDCYFFNCLSDSVIVKGDTGSGDAWNNTISNLVIDGDGSNAFTRAGPVRIQNVHASTTTRWITVSNVTVKNSGEGAILIQQIAGFCASMMISNVVSYNNGDAAIRADFDVDGATDVHFSNCMSASRAAGWGFRTQNGADRIRAMNCSSDFTGAGRVTGVYDYLDLGSGAGVDFARIQNLTFDDPVTAAMTVRRSGLMRGAGTAASGVNSDACTITWMGSPNYTAMAFEIIFAIQSGDLGKIYHYHGVIARAGATTLKGTIEAIGTAGLAPAGSGFSLVVVLDFGVANVGRIRVSGSGGAVPYTYEARILSVNVGAWQLTNTAA